jgi:hypothetical protein
MINDKYIYYKLKTPKFNYVYYVKNNDWRYICRYNGGGGGIVNVKVFKSLEELKQSINYFKEKYKIKEKRDNVLDLFGKLSFDIQEIIFDKVMEIKDREYNERMFSLVINELTYNMNNYRDDNNSFIGGLNNGNLLNTLYRDFHIGERVIGMRDDYYCVVDLEYDNMYYSDLDFILDCKCNTIIDIDMKEIQQSYKIKDNLLYKYRHIIFLDDEEIDDIIGLVKQDNFCICIDIDDWLEVNYNESMIIKNSDLYDIIMDNNYDIINRDGEKLKQLFYNDCVSGYNVFYW